MDTQTTERIAPLGQLADQWLDLIQLIEDAGGEITPELAPRFDALAIALGEKADDIAHIFKSLELQEKALRAKASEFERMARARAHSADRLEQYVLSVLGRLGVTRLEGQRYQLLGKKSQRAVVENPAQLPESYWKPPKAPEIDLAAVKRALQDGLAVPGAKLVPSHYLQVR